MLVLERWYPTILKHGARMKFNTSLGLETLPFDYAHTAPALYFSGAAIVF